MSIKGGLDFIEGHQRLDGGFWEYRLAGGNQEDPLKYRTTYAPIIIALALAEVPGGGSIRKKVASFLDAEKSDVVSWNYWCKGSVISRSKPYPDDLDDTFLALNVLWQQNKQFFSPKTSARIAQLLFANEVQPGGPYRTWLVSGETKEWSGVDAAVNANIAGFLALQDIELPYVTSLVESAIGNGGGGLISQYYPSPIHSAYFISKWYKGDLIESLQNIVLDMRKDGKWQDAHQTALSVTALIRLGYPATELNEAVEYLRTNQATNGSWPAGAMCVGIGGCLSGASSLTTALCIEAITLHKKALQRQPSSGRVKAPKIHNAAIRKTHKRLALIANQDDLQLQLSKVLNRILSQDKDGQIVELPRLIATAAGIKTSKDLLDDLSSASLWGWMAYTVYDDFLDNEGDPISLPSAVFSQRQMSYVFAKILPKNRAFHDEIDMIFNRIDQANTWEIKYCRTAVVKQKVLVSGLPDYGDYWQLADRSLGHSIAGLGIFYGAAVDPSSRRMEGLRSFFRHYLIARQLNDDAHDWEKDLALGHVNAVAVQIIGQWQKVHPRKKTIHLTKDKETLELIMWETVIDAVCRDIDWHIDQAQLALGEAELDEVYVMPLLHRLKEATKKALKDRNDALEFIESLKYKG